MATNMATIPLGVMVGGPNGSDAAVQAAFDASFRRFTAAMGATPEFMNAYVDLAKPISEWAANASWTAWSWRQSDSAQTVTPVIGLPMATNFDWGNQAQVFRDFAAGKYDDALRGIVQSWASHGYNELYIRPGYEMNGSWMPWYMGDDAATQKLFVAAFQHIADVLHAAPGADVKVVWNPNIQNWNSADLAAQYPGDKYVDVVAGDIYSPMAPRDLYSWSRNDGTQDASFADWAADPVNRMHYWTYPDASKWAPTGDGQGNSLSLTDLIALAGKHGKEFGLAETGAGGFGTNGPLDDGAFPQWLAATLQNADVKMAFANIWDISPGDGDWRFTDPAAGKPQEAASWIKYFGAAARSQAAEVVVGDGPDQIRLKITEDAWQGHAQFTVSVDGKQVGGTLTAGQTRGLGATQLFTLRGNFGTGAHKVAVTFVNDGYGGAGADRNLFVEGVQYGSAAVTAQTPLYSNGTASFVLDPKAPVTIGSGPSRLVLTMSEDRTASDAQFTVSVDGKPIGGVLTTSAIHGAGEGQDFVLLGDFAAGTHQVAITFINDEWSAALGLDRNLYVNSIGFGSAKVAGGGLYANGTSVFTVNGDPSLQLGTGPDSITLKLSEDAWQGDAQFRILLDGRDVSGVQTVSASHAAGQSQTVVLRGAFQGAKHEVAVSFLNDAWGGQGADRNLYVDQVSYGAQTTPVSGALWSNGTLGVTLGASPTVAANLAFHS